MLQCHRCKKPMKPETGDSRKWLRTDLHISIVSTPGGRTNADAYDHHYVLCTPCYNFLIDKLIQCINVTMDKGDTRGLL